MAPLVAVLVVVVVAAGFLVWSVVGLVSAGADVDEAKQAVATATEHLEDLREDDTIAVKTARDEAHEAARTAVVTMNTLDYREADAGLDAWEAASTGELHDEIVRTRAESRRAIVDAKSVTKATVLSSAVEAVDDRAGTATVLAAVRVTVSTAGNEPTDKYQRLQCTLLRTEQGWKLDSLGQVPAQQ